MYILDGVALVGYVMSHWRIPVPVFDQHDTTWLLTEASSTDPVSWSIPKPRSMRKHPKPPPGQASSKNPARILSLYRAMRIEAPEKPVFFVVGFRCWGCGLSYRCCSM
eukprot:GEMP01107158.1.p1 GENE.GEMP01107158.1~~GEMP01107158.1.p1  ORF type:complete len:108 (+),score=10.39 GEMP01107158.1:138-461(+)